ncbi:MAG: hydrogenase nickel incorporation protein HypB [Methylococcaceae bacterium]|jgi:hydrogenase nickel incorporation protein HypB|nr:hydrogenase nickel incorporation protein HypB [Methylococcaceae bacterium]MDZ4155133.1 hydrogenase nickel incorporation protein HypB [Methylococcales bacterium]MDP2394423.1 hydrogenase nickel incorporation protein HypB [Methylococcaceae bacterium]MDP3021466.1 hydrogenase nickel incorporation protein HypB [Methylococcaceae bacterium]MDP3389981.1 hydrogenase nickel incorporation protein HypB [Methylococcaceae bacterium]
MCGICGCGSPEQKQSHKFVFKREHQHHHDELDTGRLIQLEQDLLGKNNTYATQNREYFKQHKIFVLNLVSSPGAGKTTLLVETIKALNGQFPIAVIEGDQQTEHDADRIRATGTPALQINTGRACHLEALGIGQALFELDVKDNSLLAIENVGNLVCPSSFDLGEAHKVVVLSVTEGDDKPLKYPDMFHAADLMLINKTDLLPYVDFDVERCIGYAKQVNPDIQIICLSSTKGDNFSSWTDWLAEQMHSQI